MFSSTSGRSRDGIWSFQRLLGTLFVQSSIATTSLQKWRSIPPNMLQMKMRRSHFLPPVQNFSFCSGVSLKFLIMYSAATAFWLGLRLRRLAFWAITHSSSELPLPSQSTNLGSTPASLLASKRFLPSSTLPFSITMGFNSPVHLMLSTSPVSSPSSSFMSGNMLAAGCQFLGSHNFCQLLIVYSLDIFLLNFAQKCYALQPSTRFSRSFTALRAAFSNCVW